MPPKPTDIVPVPSKGRSNRVMMLLEAMTDDERSELFEEIGETYCTNLACSEAGIELPDADSEEPDHECDDEDEAEDGGDEAGPDDNEDEDEEENANEPP